MKPSTTASARIYAAEKWNQTGITLTKGEVYRITAVGLWVDLDFSYGPAGGPAQSIFQRVFEWARRRPHDDWFTLIGAIDAQDPTMFRIGSSYPVYTPPKSGQLTCFANDCPWAYGNNKGFVDLTVTRIG